MVIFLGSMVGGECLVVFIHTWWFVDVFQLWAAGVVLRGIENSLDLVHVIREMVRMAIACDYSGEGECLLPSSNGIGVCKIFCFFFLNFIFKSYRLRLFSS